MVQLVQAVPEGVLSKTPEGVFRSRLRDEFELSPALGKGILELARECLFGEIPQTPGKLLFWCASRRARHGLPLSEQEKKRVVLTLVDGSDDMAVLQDQGSSALRQLRVLRVTEEAYQQGGLLTQEDLAYLLHVSVRTIRNDVKALIRDGQTVHTRGYDHDIGRGGSHKSRIVELYLNGFTYDTIMRRTRHSAAAIRRYVTMFGRMLLLIEKGFTKPLDLCHLLQISPRLAEEYLALFEKYRDGDLWPSIYSELLDQLRALYPVAGEKKESAGGGVDAT